MLYNFRILSPLIHNSALLYLFRFRLWYNRNTRLPEQIFIHLPFDCVSLLRSGIGSFELSSLMERILVPYKGSHIHTQTRRPWPVFQFLSFSFTFAAFDVHLDWLNFSRLSPDYGLCVSMLTNVYVTDSSMLYLYNKRWACIQYLYLCIVMCVWFYLHKKCKVKMITTNAQPNSNNKEDSHFLNRSSHNLFHFFFSYRLPLLIICSTTITLSFSITYNIVTVFRLNMCINSNKSTTVATLELFRLAERNGERVKGMQL